MDQRGQAVRADPNAAALSAAGEQGGLGLAGAAAEAGFGQGDRTALLQVLSFVVDSAAGIGEAVVHPRIHWDGETCQVEPGLSARALATLRRDAPVNEWESLDVYFGGVHAVTPDGVGAGDPRRGGAVRVVGD